MRHGLIFLPAFFLAAYLSGCTLPQPVTPPVPESHTATPAFGTTTTGLLRVSPSVTANPPTTPPAPTAIPTTTQPSVNPFPTLSSPSPRAFTPTASPRPATITPTFLPYPDTPDGVVEAFLEAYPDDETLMLRCLSKARRAALPPGGAGELLRVQGDLEGFVIQSATVQPNPPQAVVTAAIQAGGDEVQRTFTLIREQQGWVIEGISD